MPGLGEFECIYYNQVEIIAMGAALSYLAGAFSTAAGDLSNASITKVSASPSMSNAGNESDDAVITVLEKLKKHPSYKDMREADLQKEAERLSNQTRLHESFSHLVEECLLNIQTNLEDSQELAVEYSTSQEVAKSKERAHHRHIQASKLDVKIRLSKVNLTGLASALASLAWDHKKLFEYGALHASICVEDVWLEWGRESLVIPRWDDGFITKDTKLVAEVSTSDSSLAATAEKTFSDLESNPDDTFPVHFKTMVEKSRLIDEVVKVIAIYNTKCYYHILHRNCQNFVRDIKEALDLKSSKFADPAADKFMKELESTRGKLPQCFIIHADLDKVVLHQDLDKMDKDNLQFLLWQYELVHIEEECQRQDCQYELVHQHYDEKQKQTELS